jgi:hypothetical protein
MVVLEMHLVVVCLDETQSIYFLVCYVSNIDVSFALHVELMRVMLATEMAFDRVDIIFD